MELKPRDTQTAIKHQILSRYLDKWAGIILNPKKRASAKQYGQRSDLHFVYVDCFSYLGRYAGDKYRSDETVFGSPIIGIQSLDKLAKSAKSDGLDIRVNAILIEKSPEVFDGLLETLSLAGLSSRVRKTIQFEQLKPGEIAVVNHDSTALAKELVNYTTLGHTWAFYLLDPWGADIPYSFVQSIVNQKHHDVMINFMYQDLNRKGGMTRSSKIGPQQKQQIDNWTAVFGDEDWKKVEQQTRYAITSIAPEETSKHVERALVEHYEGKLKKMDSQLTVKLVDLQFPERDRTMFYLFLTTHDPTGALSLNKILYDAKLWEYKMRDARRQSKETEQTGQMSWFALMGESVLPNPPARVDVEDIASDILRRFKGQTATRREIYQELADEEYFAEEIAKALTLLKRNGKAQFEGALSHDKPPIQFS
jgi:three-Cys-motif partner protein